MLNTKSFSQYCGAVTTVCITSLLVMIAGCSTSKPPETPSPIPGSAVTPELSAKTTDTTANSIVAPVEQYPEVPKAFQGVWNADIEQCRSQGSETRLEIHPQRIHFYESQGPIQEVMSDGKTILKVKVELSGEGETWLTESEFQLSEDQNTLTAISDDTPFVRYRCS